MATLNTREIKVFVTLRTVCNFSFLQSGVRNQALAVGARCLVCPASILLLAHLDPTNPLSYPTFFTNSYQIEDRKVFLFLIHRNTALILITISEEKTTNSLHLTFSSFLPPFFFLSCSTTIAWSLKMILRKSPLSLSHSQTFFMVLYSETY
jgi:hypothetical protein